MNTKKSNQWLFEAPKTRTVNSAKKYAHGECAAAELEEIQLIARFVVEHDEALQQSDVLLNAVPKCAAGKIVPRVGGPDPLVVIDDLKSIDSRSPAAPSG